MNINGACRCKKKKKKKKRKKKKEKKNVRSSGKILTKYGKIIYNSKYINKRMLNYYRMLNFEYYFFMYSATKYRKYTFKSYIITQEIQIECLLE